MSTPENASSSSSIVRRRKKCQSFKVISYIVEILKEHYTDSSSSKFSNGSKEATVSPSAEMSQFSSAGQIVGLFTFATIVSIALIFLINAEVESRADHLALAVRQQQQQQQIQVQGSSSSSVDVSSNNRNNKPAESASKQQQRGNPASTSYVHDSSSSGYGEPLSEPEPQRNYPRQTPVRAPAQVVRDVGAGNGDTDGIGADSDAGEEEEDKTAAYTARIPNHNNANAKNKKPTSTATASKPKTASTAERTNFLTYFGSQIIKLFTSVNSNINLVHLGKFEDDEHQVAVTATATGAHKSSGAGTNTNTNVNAISSLSQSQPQSHSQESPTFESHRMKRAANGGSVNGRRENERRMVSSTFTAGNAMDGNNNNVKNENFVLSSTFNGGGDGDGNEYETSGSASTSNNHNVRNSNGNGKGNGNGNGRNYAGVIGSPASKVPGSSVTSDFHKIRHAMKKLENDGGLEGDVVLRMMLGPNAKIVEARQPPPPPPQQQQHQNPHQISVPFPAPTSAPTTSTSTTAAAPRTADPEDGDGDGDDVFRNFRERLTSFRNKNTIDWKSYADEDADEIDDDEDEGDDDEDEGDDDETDAEEENDNENGARAEIDEVSGTGDGKPVMNWPDEETQTRTGANEDGKDPSSSSSFIFRAVVPGERKHSRNYYTDGGEVFGHGPSHSHVGVGSTNTHTRKSDTVKIVKVSVPNSFSVDDLNNINNSDEEDEEIDDNIFLASANNRIVNISASATTTVDTNTNGSFGLGHSHATATKKSVIKEGIDTICYKTDDVLIVIAITCCLNFAFVLIIWTSVKWFSLATGTGSKEKQFQHLECEDGLTEPVADLFRDDTADRDPDDPLLYWPPAAARKHANAHRGGSTRRSGRKSSYDYSRGISNTASIGANYGDPGLHRRTTTTTSMYSFRPADSCGTWTGGTYALQKQQMRRSYSYSMEDLRFYNCT